MRTILQHWRVSHELRRESCTFARPRCRENADHRVEFTRGTTRTIGHLCTAHRNQALREVTSEGGRVLQVDALAGPCGEA